VPTPEQQREVHERVALFAGREPPTWCRPERIKPARAYSIYAGKLAPETVSLLRDSGWGRVHEDGRDTTVVDVEAAVGSIVMSAFADACSSATFTKITSDPGGFMANCNMLLAELGSDRGLVRARDAAAAPADASVAGDVGVLLADVPYLMGSRDGMTANVMRRLLEVREDPEVDARRRAFCDQVDKYLAALRGAKEGERKLVIAEFSDAIEQDLKVLQVRLGRLGVETLLSKDNVLAVLVGGGVAYVANPTLGFGAAAAVALGGAAARYQAARQAALDKHWSSWILGKSRRKFSVW
jgi:hypothetical protein